MKKPITLEMIEVSSDLKFLACAQYTVKLIELETKINNYKQLYRLNENKEVLSHLLDNVLNLKPNTLNLVNKICDEYKTTKDEVLTPIIERHINKTLKKDGVVKEKNKHTVKSESELLEALIDMVENYKKLPIEERKFISPTSVYKYFREYIESFTKLINVKYIIDENLESQDYTDSNGIYLFCQEIPIGMRNNNIKKMLLNTEQCSQLKILKYCTNILNNHIEIVDYSQENINLLKDTNKLHYLPYQYRMHLLYWLLQYKTNAKMDETTRLKFTWDAIKGVRKFAAAIHLSYLLLCIVSLVQKF